MLKFETALALGAKLKDVTTKDHFGSEALCTKKRIFATFWSKKNTVNLRLNPDQQSELIHTSKAFEAIPNAWGKKGWTTVNLQLVDRKLFLFSLEMAFKEAQN